MNIYVGNFPYRTAETDLREVFQGFGQVDSVLIIKDRFSGRSKGFGFVQMPDTTQAETAIRDLNGKDFGGRKIYVTESRPRSDSGRGQSAQRNTEEASHRF